MNEGQAPRVSVVLPTHNRSDTLRRAIASVLAQTFSDLELIVVDDGSSENIRDIVDAFGDPRTVYERREHSGGPGAARNAGLRRARGELVAFQDSDDEWLVSLLERQMAALDRDAGAGLACAGYIIDHEHGALACVLPEPALLDETAVLRHFHFFPPMWLARKSELLRAGGFDESLPSREDWELAIRLRAACRFTGVKEPLVIKHRGPASVSANLPAHATSLARILDRHRARFAAQPAAEAAHLRELGLLQFLFENESKGRRTLLRSARTQPPGARALAWWCASWIGQPMARRIHHRLRHRTWN